MLIDTVRRVYTPVRPDAVRVLQKGTNDMNKIILTVASACAAGTAMAGDIVATPSNDGGGEGLLIMLAIGALLILNGTRSSGRGKTVEQDTQDDDSDILMRF